MLALAATSDELRKFDLVKRRLNPYAGPQCYAHLDRNSEDYRVRANERMKEGAEDEEADDVKEVTAPGGEKGDSAVMDESCWLRCMSCEKWRCVDATCAQGLRGTSYFHVRKTDLDWAAWLGKAEERYGQAVAGHVHALESSEAAGGGMVEVLKSDADGGVADPQAGVQHTCLDLGRHLVDAYLKQGNPVMNS